MSNWASPLMSRWPRGSGLYREPDGHGVIVRAVLNTTQGIVDWSAFWYVREVVNTIQRFLDKAVRDRSRHSVLRLIAFAVALMMIAPSLTLVSDDTLHHRNHVQVAVGAPVSVAHSEAGHSSCPGCPDHAWDSRQHVADGGLPRALASSQLVFSFAENHGRSIDHDPLQRPPRA